MITLKLERGFLKQIDGIVKGSGHQNRTEFIHSALREKVDEAKLKAALVKLAPLRGALKGKTTDEELEKIREKVQTNSTANLG